MSAAAHGDSGEVARLLAASVAGDRSAFERLVDLHKNLVWAVIRAHHLSNPDAEDVFQVVFLRLYERQSTIEDGTKLAGWLATTARRECYDAAGRARRDHGGIVDDLTEGGDDPATDVLRRLVDGERRSAVAAAFLTLPVRCRDLLRLLVVDEELNYDDVARALGMPRGSIGPTRRRCIERLRHHPDVRPLGEDEP